MGPGEDHRGRPRAAAGARLQHLSGTRSALVPLDRAPGWLDRFTTSHGATELTAAGGGGVLLGARDGARARWTCAGRDLAGGAEPGRPLAPEDVLGRLTAPRTALVLLLRRGGGVAGVVSVGAVAAGDPGGGPTTVPPTTVPPTTVPPTTVPPTTVPPTTVPPVRVVDARVRTARVQSRTAAGGWSQQRFARRRAGQASALARDCAATASAVWHDHVGSADLLAVGGDRSLLEECLGQVADARLVVDLPRQELRLPADPRRRVLDALAGDVGALQVDVTDP